MVSIPTLFILQLAIQDFAAQWKVAQVQEDPAKDVEQLTFMTPLFGIAFGVWLLDEPLEPSFMVGALLVLAGVFLVNSDGWLKHLLNRLDVQAR